MKSGVDMQVFHNSYSSSHLMFSHLIEAIRTRGQVEVPLIVREKRCEVHAKSLVR